MRVLVIVMAVLALAGCGQLRIERAKEQVRERMRDPSSVQFREVYLAPDRETVCGEFNAKNGYGAYTGFETFIVTNGRVVTAPEMTTEDVRREGRYARRIIDDANETGNMDRVPEAEEILEELRTHLAQQTAYSEAMRACAGLEPAEQD